MPRPDWEANTIENIFRPRGLYPQERISTVLDVGTHAEHLARYVTGLEIDQLCAGMTRSRARCSARGHTLSNLRHHTRSLVQM